MFSWWENRVLFFDYAPLSYSYIGNIFHTFGTVKEQKVNGYDQEIPDSHTADQPTAWQIRDMVSIYVILDEPWYVISNNVAFWQV